MSWKPAGIADTVTEHYINAVSVDGAGGKMCVWK